jgi:hypothetical protein
MENLACDHRQQMVQHRSTIAFAGEKVVANYVPSDDVLRHDALQEHKGGIGGAH